MTTPESAELNPDPQPKLSTESIQKDPAPSSPVLKRKSRVILAVIIVGVLLFSLIAYVLAQSRSKQGANQPQTTTPAAEELGATPSPVPIDVSKWQTYTNTTFSYSIKYPEDWTIREFPDTKTGATFRPSNLPNDYKYEYISIDKSNRVMFDGQPNLSFAEYVKKAGAEIQNYNDLNTIKKVVTDSGITGYTATWKVQPITPGKGEEGVSPPRTYFEIPGNSSATIQVVLDNEKYLDIYNQMLLSFKLLEKNPESVNPNLKTYISPKLGISFTYLEKQGSQTIYVKENGNIICVTSDASNTNCSTGQSVEVFQKGATETLKAAINRIFLAGKDQTRCLVTISDPSNYPPTFVQGEITFPKSGEIDLEKMAADTEYCSKNYAQTNGIRYFLEDKLHPTKFLFISIGQYSIASENNKTWQETISLQ